MTLFVWRYSGCLLLTILCAFVYIVIVYLLDERRNRFLVEMNTKIPTKKYDFRKNGFGCRHASLLLLFSDHNPLYGQDDVLHLFFAVTESTKSRRPDSWPTWRTSSRCRPASCRWTSEYTKLFMLYCLDSWSCPRRASATCPWDWV